MKTIKLKKTLWGLALTLCSVTLLSSLSSCSKDDGDNNSEMRAHLKIVNAAEGSMAQELYLNNAKANINAIAYTQSSAYSDVNSGNQTAEFKSSGNTTVNSTATVNLQAGKHYTLYYTGGTSTSASYITEDNLTAPSSGKAKVKFVHLSSAVTSAVDIGIQGGQKFVNGLTYKMASAYSEVEAASKFNLFLAGSANAALALNDINLQAGKIYTIYVTGSTTATIKYNVIVHN